MHFTVMDGNQIRCNYMKWFIFTLKYTIISNDMYGLHKFWLQYYLKLIFLFNINNTFKICILFFGKAN